jgi:hypothetical protein
VYLLVICAFAQVILYVVSSLNSLYWNSSTGKMLGQILVTKQSGPEGKIVSKV